MFHHPLLTLKQS